MLRFSLLEKAQDAAPEGVLDGRGVADALLEEVQRGVERLADAARPPHLVVVQIGADPASTVYVRHKMRACERVGIRSGHLELPEDVSRQEVIERLIALRQDPEVDGVLLQLPVPEQVDADAAIDAIGAEKDIDGFHPLNLGRLVVQASPIEPCTPTGIMLLLRAARVDLRGREAVVIGRSRIVGRPMAQMLQRADATITVCHRHTRDLAAHVGRAEVLVVATGVPRLVQGDWIRPGAVVVDVGITRDAKTGKLIGDVDFEAARERASLITPVPGGVGPMTVATLLWNALRAAARHQDIKLSDLLGAGADLDENG